MGFTQSKPDETDALITVGHGNKGIQKYTLGGIIIINGKPYGLTVGHAFGDFVANLQDRPGHRLEVRDKHTDKVASLNLRQEALDWAILDLLPDNSKTPCIFPKYQDLCSAVIFGLDSFETPKNAPVFIFTGLSGVETGNLHLGDTPSKSSRELKATGVPGDPKLWRVVMGSRTIEPEDMGSWVFDTLSGELYGHLVKKDEKKVTNVGYIVLARDIISDIKNQGQNKMGPWKGGKIEMIEMKAPKEMTTKNLEQTTDSRKANLRG